MAIDWIFFDVGGVLLDDSPLRRWKESILLEIARRYVPTLTIERVVSTMRIVSGRPGSVVVNALRVLVRDPHEYRQALARLESLSPAMRAAAERQTVRTEALEVVSVLSERYCLGLLANQPEAIRKKLAEGRVLSHFAYRNVSADSAYEKPSLVFFRDVLARAGVQAANSAVVDDSIERGIIPGREVGMTTIWFQTPHELDRPRPAAADYVVSSLGEILTLPFVAANVSRHRVAGRSECDFRPRRAA